MDSAELVGEEEDGAGQVGFERGFFIVTSEDSVFPDEQIGVAAAEFVPVINARAGGGACHALADEEAISVGDGLVIEAGLATGGGVALQRGGEFVERPEGRVLREIGECQVDVVGVMERRFRDQTGFELLD